MPTATDDPLFAPFVQPDPMFEDVAPAKAEPEKPARKPRGARQAKPVSVHVDKLPPPAGKTAPAPTKKRGPKPGSKRKWRAAGKSELAALDIPTLLKAAEGCRTTDLPLLHAVLAALKTGNKGARSRVLAAAAKVFG